MKPLKTIKISISGRVQGVGFRYFTQAKAKAYGLKGYVRNIQDNTVEVVATGELAIIEALVEDVQRGPPGSRVVKCQISWLDNVVSFSTFSITY